ncbi:MAG: hypothetical protein WCF85_03965 [Rhodospirillaceae bacterium]
MHRIIVVDADSQGQLANKNAEAARKLFTTIQQSLLGACGDRDQVSVQELTANLKKFEDRWPTIESFFTRAADEAISSLCYVAQDRRKDHLTRLIFARILMSVTERPVAKSATPYPRLIIPGLPTVFMEMFTKPEWSMLNRHAKWVFEFIGSDSDQVIVQHLKENNAVKLFSEQIFVSLLLRFYRFNVRRSEMVRTINDALPDGVQKIGDPEFCELYEAMFNDIYATLRTEDGRARIEMSHGEEFLARVRGIQDQYLRYKEGITAPKPVRRQA